jgi:hypothetical protein
MVVTSRSVDSPNWDPWADIKEDGTVDIYDAITLANAFGSSGETPKNVNVTNWPRMAVMNFRVNITWYDYGTSYGVSPGWPTFSTSGYSRMTIMLSVVDWSPFRVDIIFTTITIARADWTVDPNAVPVAFPLASSASVDLPMFAPNPPGTYNALTETTTEIIGPQFFTLFDISSGIQEGSVLVDVYVYMRNE